MRDLEVIDSELRLVAALRRAAAERGGPLPSIGVADALLDKCWEWTKRVPTNAATTSFPRRPTRSGQSICVPPTPGFGRTACARAQPAASARMAFKVR
jgi:hypothetical protein